jgi:ATP-dependent RNA helicase DDX18/HAS1
VGWLVSEGYLETDDLQAVVMDECDVLLGDSFEFAEQVEPLKVGLHKLNPVYP